MPENFHKARLNNILGSITRPGNAQLTMSDNGMVLEVDGETIRGVIAIGNYLELADNPNAKLRGTSSYHIQLDDIIRAVVKPGGANLVIDTTGATMVVNGQTLRGVPDIGDFLETLIPSEIPAPPMPPDEPPGIPE